MIMIIGEKEDNMEKLNTMESYVKEGFKIIRDGQVITLTNEEMSRFRFMEQALNGRSNIEAVLEDDDDYNQDIVEQMIDDENLCHELQEYILNAMSSNVEDEDVEIIKNHYDWYVDVGQHKK
ncbi:MAG: hypothetical protein ACLRT4_20305 [Thomasclavelia sp.]